jgi:Uma2 family endonuclease
MNLHVRQIGPETTQGAEGLPRRAWTLAEVEQMVEAGIIGRHERFELIDGEIVPMSPKGAFHENVKRALNRFWTKALPAETEVLTETTLRIGSREFREPDFVFWPGSVAVADLKPEHLQLTVEISDSSLDYDLGRKAAYYASIGLTDYWVIDAQRLVTTVHRDPGPSGFGTVTKHDHGTLITPLLLPALAVRLADLGLTPAV